MPGPLDAAQTTLDGAGAGTVQLGPVPTYRTWRIDRIAVVASGGTGTAESVAKVYRGDGGDDSRFLDGTYSGNLDTSDYPTGLTLGQGERITVVWAGGRPGAVATARAEGEAF